MQELIIIGGGASGLAAAITAARTAPELPIRVLEAQDRAGRKLLSTGNGRCNLTNQNPHQRCYHSQSGKRLGRLLRGMDAHRTLDFFQRLGLYCTSDEAGRWYPACRQASMVQEILLLAVERAKNITLETNCRVERLSALRKGLHLTAGDGRSFTAGAVILAAGGQAAPKLGGSDSGCTLAQRLGHSIVTPQPCLVPLKCRSGALRALKGVRVLCRSSLYSQGKRLAVEDGEIQFTDYGLSGIPALQFSCRLRAQSEVGLDLLPGWSADALLKELERRLRAHADERVEDALLGLVHRRIQYALLKELEISPTGAARSVSEARCRLLARSLKDWRFPVTGTLGWDQAQVTAGGVSLDEVQEDFSSVFEPRLFLAGEVLDVAGDCGGYNLHWAWCSGMEAGRAAAELCSL